MQAPPSTLIICFATGIPVRAQLKSVRTAPTHAKRYTVRGRDLVEGCSHSTNAVRHEDDKVSAYPEAQRWALALIKRLWLVEGHWLLRLRFRVRMQGTFALGFSSGFRARLGADNNFTHQHG
jgi:hypothetical protein